MAFGVVGTDEPWWGLALAADATGDDVCTATALGTAGALATAATLSGGAATEVDATGDTPADVAATGPECALLMERCTTSPPPTTTSAPQARKTASSPGEVVREGGGAGLCHVPPLPVVCWKLAGDAGDIMPSGTVPGIMPAFAALPPPTEGDERAIPGFAFPGLDVGA